MPVGALLTRRLPPTSTDPTDPVDGARLVSDHGVMVTPTAIADADPDPRDAAVGVTAMDHAEAVSLSLKFKAISDPTRVRLLSLVAAHAGAEACVCDLTEPVNLSQPTVSHHLKILVHAGLLSRSQRGSWSFYSVVPGAVDAVADLLRASLGDRPAELAAS